MRNIKPLASIAKGTAYAALGVVLARFLNYLFRLIVARLGSEEYGLYNLGFAIATFLATLAMCGFYTGIRRFVPYYLTQGNEKKIKGILYSVFRISVPLSIAFSLMLFFFSDSISANVFKNPELSPVLKIFSLTLPFLTAMQIIVSSLTSFQRIDYAVFIRDILANVARILLVLILIYTGYGLTGVVVGHAISTVIAFAIGLYLMEKKVFPFLKTKIKPEYSHQQLLEYSLPLLLSGIFVMVLDSTDTLMLGYFKTASDVGLYNAALPTARLIQVIPYAIIQLFLVVITESHAKGEDITSIYRTVCRWIFLLSMPMLLVFATMPEKIMSVVFGSEYAPAAMPLLILTTALLVDGFFMPASQVLALFKKTRLILKITFTAAFLNVILNYVMTPRYGITGTALATGVSVIIFGLMQGYNSFKLTGKHVFSRSHFKILAAGMITLLLATYIKSYVNLQKPVIDLMAYSILTLLIYAALMLALKPFEQEDMELFNLVKKAMAKAVGR